MRPRIAKRIALPVATEAQEHFTLVGHLKWMLRPAVVWWHTGNGELRSRAAAVKLHRMGVMPGIPDFLFLAAGVLYGLELKRRRGGATSAAQADMQRRLVGQGAVIATARGCDEAMAIIAGWGLLRRGKHGLQVSGHSSHPA